MTAVVLRGDAAHLPLPNGSVDLICTSPPYWKQRDYRDGGQSLKGQIGNEATPGEYIANLLKCTQEWMRVLKPGGSIFVVLGDKYAPSGKSLLFLPERYRIGCVTELGLIARAKIVWFKTNHMPESADDRVCTAHEDIVHLVKQPRYFSAVDEIREPHQTPGVGGGRRHGGAAFRSDAKVQTADGSRHSDGNPLGKLPGSVWEIPTLPLFVPDRIAHARCCGGRKRPGCKDELGHYAAYPPALVQRIILGWAPSGICVECGEGRRPVPVSVALDMSRPQARRAHRIAEQAGLTEAHFGALLSVGVSDTGRGAATQSGTGKNTVEVYELAAQARAALGGYAREYLLRRPTGFGYACACPDASAPTRPALIADPFGGTGTTALVADLLGRDGFMTELSADYIDIAEWRINDPAERARALGVPKPPPVPEGQGSLFDEAS
jgi:DNA methylase